MLKDPNSGEVMRVRLAAKGRGESLAADLLGCEAFVQWAIEKYKTKNQSEIVELLQAVLRREGALSEEDVPVQVQDTVRSHVPVESSFNVIRLALCSLLNKRASESELKENFHRTKSEAAKNRRQVVRQQVWEKVWTDEESIELLHAMRTSAESTADYTYKLGEVLDSMGLSGFQSGDNEYDRVRHQISKMIRSIIPFDQESYNPTIIPLEESEGILLLRVLRMEVAFEGAREPNWTFILSEMKRITRREIEKDSCIKYIRDVRMVTYPKRGKVRRKQK